MASAPGTGCSPGFLPWSEQFRDAHATLPFVHTPRLAFRSAAVAGRNWALLPSAAGVIDPLLSTGFPLTLLGILRVAGLLETHVRTRGLRTRSRRYGRATLRELDVTEQLVGGAVREHGRFRAVQTPQLLYFAAASYTETVRRLGRPAAPGFLLRDDPSFGPELRAARTPRGDARAADPRDALSRIDRAIEPFDVAGLRDRARRDWYPVRAGDLLESAGRFNTTPDDIVERLPYLFAVPR